MGFDGALLKAAILIVRKRIDEDQREYKQNDGDIGLHSQVMLVSVPHRTFTPCFYADAIKSVESKKSA